MIEPMARYARIVLLVIGALATMSADARAQVELESAFPALPLFDRPVDLQRSPADSGRLFVVEQGGVVVSFEEENAVALDTLVDLRDVVLADPEVASWEEGLLGLAFHPDYAANRYVFVYYSAYPRSDGEGHRSIVSRFTVAPGSPSRIDRESEVILLDIEQPLVWHNGGQLAFHPNEDEANLYISFGDGGGGSDPFNHGQNRRTLFGSILRIDVDAASDDRPYGIPADNPFVGNGQGWREEIWAYGLRNPWRFSIDPETGWLWVGDVGQALREEVSVIAAGGTNLGWDVKEGPFCYREPSPGEPMCSDPILTDPIWWYLHEDDNFSVTGGRVYRGSALPELAGQYVYGDFISGRIWALDANIDGGPLNDEIARGLQISTFGEDADGELYVASFDGRIYKLVRRIVDVEVDPEAAAPTLRVAGPNPVRSAAVLVAEMPVAGRARVAVYDVLGREVAVLLDGDLGAGQHRVTWSASGVAPGLYVVRMQSAATAASVRLTVVR